MGGWVGELAKIMCTNTPDPSPKRRGELRFIDIGDGGMEILACRGRAVRKDIRQECLTHERAAVEGSGQADAMKFPPFGWGTANSVKHRRWGTGDGGADILVCRVW